MKTSKRKRSSKSEPVAPATAGGAEPVVALDPVPAESVVTESVAAANEAAVAASEPVVAEAPAVASEAPAVVPESVSAEAVVAESEPVVAEAPAVATESVSEPVAADAPSAMQAEPIVVLSANCSVKDAAALKSSLCAVANESAAVTLDASAVERVDTATMQLLCAFVRDRSSRSQSTVWRGQSQALHDAVRLLGVAALIGFDAAMGVVA